MAAPHVKREDRRTVVLSSSPDFRNTVIALLNSCAIVAEKLHADSPSNMRSYFGSNHRITNVVVDMSGMTLVHMLNEQEITAFVELIKEHDLHVVIYANTYEVPLDTAMQSPLGKLPTVSFSGEVPTKHDFIDAFIHHKHNSPGAKAAPAPAQSQASGGKPPQPVVDCAQHVRETISRIAALSKDPKAMDKLADVGQRFNGVMGTFAFFMGKDGFTEVQQQSVLIDAICRTYQANPQLAQVSAPHVQLLIDSAKVAFDVLTALLKGGPIDPGLKARATKCYQQFEADASLLKRAAGTQADVDEIMAKLVG